VPAAQPRLRDDLLITKQETREEAFFVVKDPATRRFFRFRQAEYFVARQLDGATPLDTVRERVGAELGAEPEPGVLEGFVAQLRRQGLLAPEDGTAGPGKPGGKFFGGNALWLRVRAFDPERLFTSLHPRIRFLFTPAFVTLATAVIVTGLAILLSNRAELGPDLRRLWGAHGLVLIWTAIFAVTVLHDTREGPPPPGRRHFFAYGAAVNQEESGAESIVVGSTYGGVIFTIADGKVSEIFVGAAAE